MKYFRTKDGRILLGTLNENDLTGMVLDYQNGKVVKIPIIKQADTIEELCDEFVLENEITTDSQCSLMNLKQFRILRKAICEANKTTHKNCYGAIWTEWGLKYVAKVNEKGKLELL